MSGNEIIIINGYKWEIVKGTPSTSETYKLKEVLNWGGRKPLYHIDSSE